MNPIDFLPERIRYQRSVYLQLRRQGLAILIVITVLALVWRFNEVRIANGRSDLVTQQNYAEQLAVRLSVMPELAAQLDEGQIKQRISRELGSRLTINALLAELGRLLPPAGCLTSLECSTIDSVPDAATRPDPRQVASSATSPTVSVSRKRVRVVITGIAPTAIDIADFIGKLSASPVFTDVKMGYTNSIVLDNQQRKARSFKVTFLVAE